MNISELQTSLRAEKLKDLYVFVNTEPYIQKVYTDKIIEISEKKKVVADSVLDIYTKIQQKGIIKQDCVYVVYDDMAYMEQTATVWDRLYKQGIQKDNIVILIYNTYDARRKFFKYHKDNFVVFEKLALPMVTKYLQKMTEFDFSVNDCELLYILSNESYTQVLIILDKIRIIQQETKLQGNKLLQYCLDNNIVHDSRGVSVFDFIDTLAMRSDFKMVNDSISKLKADKDFSVLGIITLLYTRLKILLGVKTLQNNVAENLGVNGWFVKQAIEKSSTDWTVPQIKRMMKILFEVDTGIKTGKINQDLALDYIAVNVFVR
jgi:hypothetical protein